MCPVSLSPGVVLREIDLTNRVPAVATTEAGFAGAFSWGPLNERVLIESENVLSTKFGKPVTSNAVDFLTAAAFLAYGNKLYTVRVASESANSALNATSGGTGTLITNDAWYEENVASGELAVGSFTAKYPGTLGNSLRVSTCASANAYQSTLSGSLTVSAAGTVVTGSGTAFTNQVTPGDTLLLNSLEVKVASVTNATSLVLATAHSTGASANTSVIRRWEYWNSVNTAPGTSDYATMRGGSADELHVAVIDEDGLFSGVKNTVLEVYSNVSKANDALDESGSTLYYKNQINQKSNYIRWTDHDSTITNAGSVSSTAFVAPQKPISASLAGGADGGTPSNADYIRGYDLFANPEDVDISILIGGASTSTVANHLITNIAEVRKDLMVTISPERADVVDNAGTEATDVIAFRNTLPSSSYFVMDSGWKYTYDKYADVNRYIPLSGDVAGLMVETDNSRDPWWSPAGYNRGRIKNAIKLAWNPSKGNRDLIYPLGINPVVTFPGEGTILFGDRTGLTKPSAFDRINVRRLFIVLEKAISVASKYMLFEFNDEVTRATFRNMVEPFLRDVKGRRGIYNFQVVADETNNTPEVIDRNEFVGTIFIQPAKSINVVQLDMVATRTGVSFTEIAGRY